MTLSGVLMLFPIKKSTEEHRAEERLRIENDGQICSKNVYHMKQTVGNACGTVGILHAIGNARSKAGEGGGDGLGSSILSIAPKSYLETFFASTEKMSSTEIAGKSTEEIGSCHQL